MKLDRLINRFMTTFTTQIARRGFRFIGVPNSVVPILSSVVRRLNQQIQWGNTALWNKRFAELRMLKDEFMKNQHALSPVYRFRGGSDTLRSHQPQTPLIPPKPAIDTTKLTRLQKLRAQLDPSTVFLGGLALVVVASIGGPTLAKKVNWVDPLDAASGRLSNSSPEVQLRP